MPRADLPSLIQWCRACKHGLDIGLSPVKVFRQQAKSGPGSLRSAAGIIADKLEKGESIADALAESGTVFPPLVHEIVGMSERAGRLPDAFGELNPVEREFAARRGLAPGSRLGCQLRVTTDCVIGTLRSSLKPASANTRSMARHANSSSRR